MPYWATDRGAWWATVHGDIFKATQRESGSLCSQQVGAQKALVMVSWSPLEEHIGPPASRALCQAKRAPRAAFPSGCLAAQTQVRSLGQKIPWRRKWQPTPVFLPGKSHGQGSLAGYSPRGRKGWDTTELGVAGRLSGTVSPFRAEQGTSLALQSKGLSRVFSSITI